MNQHLFTTRPERVEHRGYVPMARAAICLSCDCLFVIDLVCPNCADEHIIPLAVWLDRVGKS